MYDMEGRFRYGRTIASAFCEIDILFPPNPTPGHADLLDQNAEGLLGQCIHGFGCQLTKVTENFS